MKVNKIKAKVAAKVATCKGKVAAKCGKAAKCLLFLFALASIATGCATADAPTAQRAQNVKTENVKVTYHINVNVPAPGAASNATEKVVAKAGENPASVNFNFTTEVGTAAQANETSGTETMTNTPTQTPTNDVKPQTTLTYGLASGTAAGTDWIESLTAASAKGLATWLKSGKANGTMTVTKQDGSTETVTCKDGTCTTSSGECVTCGECTDCQLK